jgi:MFS family permease
MSTTITAPPAHEPAPARPAPLRLVAAMVFAQLGLFVALLTPVVVSLALRINALVPAGEGRAGALGLVLGVGALFAIAATPIFGQLSDRTTSRWGMRRPWLVAGTLGGLAGLAVIGAPTAWACCSRAGASPRRSSTARWPR